ncbi:MAG TPA: adenylate/guanylate cyclase domain-containing protein [Nitrososphaerales archaeon]|nr:adenylate/guanylate cyclase domain-containing protein [Nitrososphaerales archaeon]
MSDSVDVPILDKLAPDGFSYGGHYIVEFDPDSLWYETSLTIASLALKRGTKTEYHVFQHLPKEAFDGLKKLGVDAERLEKEGLLRVVDSYTHTLEYERKKKSGGTKPDPFDTDRPLDAVRGKKNWAEAAKAGFTDEDKRWLHIDDNTSIFLQYNEEDTLVDCWRTGMLPFGIRARETPHFLAFVKGVGSDAFYTKFEALCDGIIDVKAEEEGGRVENYVRVRMLRGKKFDSRWHRLELMDSGEVALEVARPEEARRLAAIMFTDIVGYTSMAHADETRTLEVLKQHRGLLRPIVVKHGGSEVKTMGDAFLIEFSSALAATECAAEIEKTLREYNKQNSRDVHVKIGIHVGDVVHEGGDVYGDAVNIAARIVTLAQGGGTCISQQVYDQVRNKSTLRFSRLGAQTLKNVSDPIDVYKLEPA